MILLDTHIWVWWTYGDKRLSLAQNEMINSSEHEGIGVSAISCWEIAKLVQYGRLDLETGIDEWFDQALSYEGIRVVELTPEIAIGSTRLPKPFHGDPADQIIVATAMIWRCPLVTSDRKLLEYAHIETVG